MPEAITQGSGLTPEQRLARIAELRRELMELLREDAQESHLSTEGVEDECLSMLKNRQPLIAVKHFRSRMGCSLGEARDAINGIAARHGVPGVR